MSDLNTTVYPEKAFHALASVGDYKPGYKMTRDQQAEVASVVADFVTWTHGAQVKAGWWTDPKTGNPVNRNVYELHALFHSEISEALEAYRKKDRMDDKLTKRRGLEVELADFAIRLGDFLGSRNVAHEFGSIVSVLSDNCEELKIALCTDSVAEQLDRIHVEVALSSHFYRANADEKAVVHLARAFLLAIFLCRRRGLDLHAAAVEKMAYNAARVDHTLAYRRDAADGKVF